MSDLWFWGSEDLPYVANWESPDPVNMSSPTWTWSIPFVTDSSQTTYARTSVNSVVLDGGYIFSGIVSYEKQNPDGSTDWIMSGWSGANGVADFISDTGVLCVVFGWGIGSSWNGLAWGRINMEVWVTS